MSDGPEIPVLAYAPTRAQSSRWLTIIIPALVFSITVFSWSRSLAVLLVTLANNLWVLSRHRSYVGDMIWHRLRMQPLATHFAICAGLWVMAIAFRRRETASAMRQVLAVAAAVWIVPLCCVYVLLWHQVAAHAQFLSIRFASSLVLLLMAILQARSIGQLRRVCTGVLIWAPLIVLGPVWLWAANNLGWYDVHWRPILECLFAFAIIIAVRYGLRLSSKRAGLAANTDTVDVLSANANMAVSQFGISVLISGHIYGIVMVGPPRCFNINLFHVPLLLVDAAAVYCLYRWRRTYQLARAQVARGR